MQQCQCLTKGGLGSQCSRKQIGDLCYQHTSCQNRVSIGQVRQAKQVRQVKQAKQVKEAQKIEHNLQNVSSVQLREIAKFMTTKDVAQLSRASKYLNKGLKQQMEERKRQPKEKILLLRINPVPGVKSIIPLSDDDIIIPADGHIYKFTFPLDSYMYMIMGFVKNPIDWFELRSPVTYGAFRKSLLNTARAALRPDHQLNLIVSRPEFIPHVLRLVGDHTYNLSELPYDWRTGKHIYNKWNRI